MKKINTLVLSALTAALLIGCGGGSSSGSTGATTGGASNLVVVPERGAIFGATVTDASGQTAEQLDPSKNEYTFLKEIIFPVTVTGGFIDMDNDITTKNDVIDFTGETLTSYSNNITPITNYLGNPSDTTAYAAKLKTLQDLVGEDKTETELKSLPSKLEKKEIFALTNAIYQAVKQNTVITSAPLSSFDNVFQNLKNSVTSTDPKAIAKDLETKVMVTELGKTILTENEVIQKVKDLGTTSDKLKIADLTRFVSYESGEYRYEDNTSSGNTITLKSYNKNYNSTTSKFDWILDAGDDSVSITKDASDPYKFSYVDPTTKEEGTFTIISTKKVDGYTNLYKTSAQIVITKAEELDPDGYNRWPYPSTMQDGVDSNGYPKYIDMTEVSQFPKRFETSSQHMGKYLATTSADGKILTYDKTVIGNWEISGEHFICKLLDGKVIYYRLASVDGKYYIEQQELDGVGSTDNETIYTGSDSELDNLIKKIKAEAPVFTSGTSFLVDENQTSAFTAVATSDANIVYSLENYSTDADKFNINSETGAVTFKKAPNYEAKTSYAVSVKATNKLNKAFFVQNINITIKDIVNEEVTTPTFTLTNEMLSGKTYKLPNSLSTTSDGYAIYKLNADKTASFAGYNADNSVDYPADNGTWTITDGKLKITTKNSTVDTYTFAATPANGVTVTVNIQDEPEYTSEIQGFADISSSTTPSTPTPTFTLTTQMLEGKTYKLPNSLSTNDGYAIYKLNADKTASFAGYNADNSVDYPADNGTWTITTDGKLQINTKNLTVDTYTFAATPANGVKVTVNIQGEPEYTSEVQGFADISSSTPTEPTPTTFTLTPTMISGKSITITDTQGTMTALFNTDNSYSESWDDTKSGGDKGTCSGTWAISENILKIRGTCSDGYPSNTNVTFTEIPKTNAVLNFADVDSTEKGSMTITSFGDISK